MDIIVKSARNLAPNDRIVNVGTVESGAPQIVGSFIIIPVATRTWSLVTGTPTIGTTDLVLHVADGVAVLVQ